MVKEIVNVQKELTEINFYPLDVIDSAPPEIVIQKDSDSNFRISQIITYNEYLSHEISKRERVIKSFKYIDWICFSAEMLLVIINILLAFVSIIFVQYNTTISSIGILVTAFSTFIRNNTKKHMKKLDKHQSLLFLTKSKLSIVQEKYSLAIRDGDVSHDEYLTIIDEFEKYQKLRQEILTKYQK